MSTASGARCLGAALLAAAASLSAAPAGPVSVTLVNNTPHAIRCTALLAHFVTRDLPVLEAGGDLRLDLARTLPAGELSWGAHAGRPMLLENLLCGVAHDWQRTYHDVTLSALRAEPVTAFTLSCTLAARLRCTASARP